MDVVSKPSEARGKPDTSTEDPNVEAELGQASQGQNAHNKAMQAKGNVPVFW